MFKGRRGPAPSKPTIGALAGGAPQAVGGAPVMGGSFMGGATPKPGFAKGGNVQKACYAEGGAVLGRSRSFVKEPTEFTGGALPPKNPTNVPQNYPKSGKGKSAPDKSIKVKGV